MEGVGNGAGLPLKLRITGVTRLYVLGRSVIGEFYALRAKGEHGTVRKRHGLGIHNCIMMQSMPLGTRQEAMSSRPCSLATTDIP